MANYMFVLRPTSKKHKTVCPACAERGEVISSCYLCHGSAIKSANIPQYYVQERPIEIRHVDRDPENGVLRYWEDASNFFYETVYPELNKYIEEVPHGIHLCHDSRQSAELECKRINTYLINKKLNKPNTVKGIIVHKLDF